MLFFEWLCAVPPPFFNEIIQTNLLIVCMCWSIVVALMTTCASQRKLPPDTSPRTGRRNQPSSGNCSEKARSKKQRKEEEASGNSNPRSKSLKKSKSSARRKDAEKNQTGKPAARKAESKGTSERISIHGGDLSTTEGVDDEEIGLQEIFDDTTARDDLFPGEIKAQIDGQRLERHKQLRLKKLKMNKIQKPDKQPDKKQDKKQDEKQDKQQNSKQDKKQDKNKDKKKDKKQERKSSKRIDITQRTEATLEQPPTVEAPCIEVSKDTVTREQDPVKRGDSTKVGTEASEPKKPTKPRATSMVSALQRGECSEISRTVAEAEGEPAAASSDKHKQQPKQAPKSIAKKPRATVDAIPRDCSEISRTVAEGDGEPSEGHKAAGGTQPPKEEPISALRSSRRSQHHDEASVVGSLP